VELMSGRCLIVSSRLPVSVAREGDTLALRPSSGGLATGLAGVHAAGESRWIGWLGPEGPATPEEERALAPALAAGRITPIALDAAEWKGFYEGYSNGLLWPLFHYATAQLPLEVRDFDAYAAVNARFADAVATEWRPGDRIWVHDYQLLLLPELLRRRLPGARIGFFLHIPWPSSEVFRQLPERERLLRGLLGADLIGFHTPSYLRHFASALLRLLGLRVDIDTTTWRGRNVRLGVFPMGIDAAGFAATAAEPGVEKEVEALRGETGSRLLLGIDRLDYTKGILRRLVAFERLLEERPELRGSVRLVQVAVPSREDVDAYQTLRRQAEERIGRIHGAFATPQWVPVHWLYRGLEREEVVALYRAADVLVVTPLRDGMNLVAKEFVASRTDEDGVLVLSEFAGVAGELAEAIHVNPYDIAGTADALARALALPRAERRARMRAMRERVFAWDDTRWTQSFLRALDAEAEGTAARPARYSAPEELEALVARARGSERCVLLLDYDGTLVPFAPAPELALPDPALHELLRRLGETPGIELHVVSGRGRESLERWLGALPLMLHAEHGALVRRGGVWEARPRPADPWRERVLAILRDFAERTPGARVEEKESCLAWHYRAADAEYGERQARELEVHLRELLSNLPVEVVQGAKLVEVRPQGVHKGLVVAEVAAIAAAGGLLIAIGDDLTDEDLFAALPPGGVAVHVGEGESAAPLRVIDSDAVREILARIVG